MMLLSRSIPLLFRKSLPFFFSSKFLFLRTFIFLILIYLVISLLDIFFNFFILIPSDLLNPNKRKSFKESNFDNIFFLYGLTF